MNDSVITCDETTDPVAKSYNKTTTFTHLFINYHNIIDNC